MTVAVGEKADHVFRFDAMFLPGSQEEVFADCKELVQSAVDGYNVTIFAYGQTGSGKTYTMAGVPGQEGITPRTIDEIFSVMDKGRDRWDYTVTGSIIELHMSQPVDLLNVRLRAPVKAEFK